MSTKAAYHYAVGKRKTAVARVKLIENGNGEITVNGQDIKDYFPPVLREIALAPLKMTGNSKMFDIEVKIVGGGPNGQSEAMRHGISRALVLFGPEHRTELKRAGFITRDSRSRERKKPGLKRARRAPQWAKR